MLFRAEIMGRQTTLLLIPVVVVVTVCAVTFWAGSGQVEGAQRGHRDMTTVWDGVYEADQAGRGRYGYELDCAECHGEDLSGARNGALKGAGFMREWSGIRLYSLFDRVEAMPPDGFSLGEDAYLDIMAYMLQVNGFPAGNEELNTGTLRGILIQGKDGPQPVPNFSLVQITGCLTRGPDKTWMVTDASQPVRTKDPEASIDDDLRYLQESGLGTDRYNLMNVYPKPDAYEGHKVEVKGFLIAGPVDRINVSTSQSLAPSCGAGGSLP